MFCLRAAKLTMHLVLAPVTVTDVLVIPVTNAGCDDKNTGHLSEEKIDCLMRLLIEGSPMYQFNFERAFCKWEEHKARRLLEQHPRRKLLEALTAT